MGRRGGTHEEEIDRDGGWMGRHAVQWSFLKQTCAEEGDD